MQDNEPGTWLARDGDGQIREVGAAGYPGSEASPGDGRPVAEAADPGHLVSRAGRLFRGLRRAGKSGERARQPHIELTEQEMWDLGEAARAADLEAWQAAEAAAEAAQADLDAREARAEWPRRADVVRDAAARLRQPGPAGGPHEPEPEAEP